MDRQVLEKTNILGKPFKNLGETEDRESDFYEPLWPTGVYVPECKIVKYRKDGAIITYNPRYNPEFGPDFPSADAPSWIWNYYHEIDKEHRRRIEAFKTDVKYLTFLKQKKSQEKMERQQKRAAGERVPDEEEIKRHKRDHALDLDDFLRTYPGSLAPSLEVVFGDECEEDN